MRLFRSLSKFLFALAAVSAHAAWDYKLCVPVEKIDFNSFRKLDDGKDMAFLLFTRPYISTLPAEKGVLKSYEFSPDGRVFTGRIESNLTWADGQKLSVQEAADGIVKTLPFRILGERMKVVKTEILDESTFRIHLDSKIENITGVVREALSTNSRHNRMWPMRAGAKPAEALTKYPMVHSGNEVGLFAYGKRVRIVTKSECANADFTMFADVLVPPLSAYVHLPSTQPSAITLQTNTAKLSLAQRQALVALARAAFATPVPELGMKPVVSFFLPGESGYDASVSWQHDFDKSAFKNWVPKLAYESPIFFAQLTEFARKNGLKLEMTALPTKATDLDGQVLASGIQHGRHVILQDALPWPHVTEEMARAPKTKASLELIAKRSASTIPPDTKTLREFEKASIAEQALAPLARKFPIAYSRAGLPLCLNWSEAGELMFSEKDACKSEH